MHGLHLLDEIPGELAAETKLFARISRMRYLLQALGSAADGEFSTFVGEQQVSQSPEKRGSQVERLCGGLRNILTVGIAESSLHAAALINVGSAQARPRRESVPVE